MAEPELVLWEQYEITEEQVKSLRLSWQIRDWNAGIFCLGTGRDIRPEDEELRWCMIVSAYGENEHGRCFRIDAPNDLGTFNNLFDALVAAEQNAIKCGLISVERSEIHDILGYDA